MINWEKISLEDLAAYLSTELRKLGVKTYLVGGACATIYSKNRYQSYDLDFVTYEEMTKVHKAMKAMGFQSKGRHYVHEGCPWLVEFISPPVAVGDEPIEEFAKKRSKFGTIIMLRLEDSVKDRLAVYYHWNDRQSLYQALDICREKRVDLQELEAWSQKEGHLKKFKEFRSLLSQKK